MAMCTTWRRCHKISQAERKRETPYFIPDLVFWWHALVDLLGELDELDFVSTSVRCSLPFDAVAGASSAPVLRPSGTKDRRGQFPLWKEEEKTGLGGTNKRKVGTPLNIWFTTLRQVQQ